ncbi:MAG: trypsin-like serine protease [Proteobacteria bacterium]|jgi:hypothetical protein|nr:trypsin-like serine protease [Pseudomonadota bacterium]
MSSSPGSEEKRSLLPILLLALLSLAILLLDALTIGSCALTLTGVSAASSLGLALALGCAFMVGLLFPLILAAKLLKLLKSRKPRPAPITFGAVLVWNVLVLGLLVALMPSYTKTSLLTHGDWVFMGRQQPVLSPAIKVAASLIPAEVSDQKAELSDQKPELQEPLVEKPLETVEEGPFTAQRLFELRQETVVVIHTVSPLKDDFFTEFLREMGVDFAEGLGSGFVISSDGLIITNHHVIDGVESARVTLRDGRVFPDVQVLTSDPTNDLALLKIEVEGLQAAPLADEQAAVGVTTYAIGSPLGMEYSLTEGIISAIRDIHGTAFYQMQTPIAPGSSGGPLFNEYGEVLGVNTASKFAGLHLAVQVEYVHQLSNAEHEPRALKHFEPSVNVVSLTANDEILPTDRAQLEGIVRVLGMKFGGCIETLPEEAQLSLVASQIDDFHRPSQLQIQSNLDEQALTCIKEMDDLLPFHLGFFFQQILSNYEKPVVLQASLSGFNDDKQGLRTLDLVLEIRSAALPERKQLNEELEKGLAVVLGGLSRALTEELELEAETPEDSEPPPPPPPPPLADRELPGSMTE